MEMVQIVSSWLTHVHEPGEPGAFLEPFLLQSRPTSAKRLLQYLISAAKHVDRRTQPGHRDPRRISGGSAAMSWVKKDRGGGYPTHFQVVIVT